MKTTSAVARMAATMSKTTTPRPMTAEEMRDIFIGHLRTFVEFWLTCELGPGVPISVYRNGEARYRMEGLIFSILSMIDGANLGVPSFDIVPTPHADLSPDERRRCHGGICHLPNVGARPETATPGDAHRTGAQAMTPNPKIGGTINVTIAVKGDFRAGYAAVEHAFATEDLPEGDELDGRPFVVQLVKVEAIEMISLDPVIVSRRKWKSTVPSLLAIADAQDKAQDTIASLKQRAKDLWGVLDAVIDEARPLETSTLEDILTLLSQVGDA